MVPKCMSTQHPDNVATPFFSDSSVIEGDAEVKEAYYAYSYLGMDEQLWDYEGKEVDSFVVSKLLASYEPFFRKNRLGETLALTLRVPNPAYQKDEAKVLLETLESIPRSFDMAKRFYGDGVAPIVEIVLPMTSSAVELERIHQYYREFVVGKQDRLLVGKRLSEWIGEFGPEEIRVIPLLEEDRHMLGAARIVESFLARKRLEFQRVWLARSDPALTYGSAAAVLLNKVALQRLHALEEKSSVEIYPIIGVGSCPFRGNFTPLNVRNCLSGYPSVQTFTAQSAFKYDFEERAVRSAVEEIRGHERKEPVCVDEKRCLELVARLKKEYKRQVRLVAPLVNRLASYIPRRRRRKLHIGMLGYSRKVEGFSLPRAIPFCASLYSAGIPPDLLGLSCLAGKDRDLLSESYRSFEADVSAALAYFNRNNLKYLPAKLRESLRKSAAMFRAEADAEHAGLSEKMMQDLARGKDGLVTEDVVKMARLRRFLG